MMKKIMMKVGDNRGMTLIEVTVALVLFVSVFAIMMFGMQGALKVMGVSNAIKEAGSESQSALELNNVTPVVGNISFTGMNGDLSAKVALYSKDTTKKSLNSNVTVNMKTLVAASSVDSNNKKVPLVTATPPNAPSEPVVTDATVNVPSYNEAYYAIGTNATQDERKAKHQYPYDNYITLNTGTFVTAAFDGMAQQSDYNYQTFGKYLSSLTLTYTVPYTTHGTVQDKYQNLQALYFIKDVPFSCTSNGGIAYSLNFLYLGDKDSTNNKLSIYTVYHIDDTSTFARTDKVEGQEFNQFIVNSFDSGENIILYVAEDITITNTKHDYHNADTTSTTILPKGYYSLPSGTNILSIAFNDSDYKTFMSYKVDYNAVKDRLKTIGISVTGN